MPPNLEFSSHTVLQELYARAELVLAGKQPPEYLKSAVEEAREMIQYRETAEAQQAIATARELYIDSACDIDIDDATLVYHNDTDGHWVLGWCFVRDKSIDEDDAEEEDDTTT